MLQDCKLSYFPLTGRGEACRLALHVKGVPFTDDRVPFPQWGTTKPTTPWMSMPVLTLADGTIAGQQRAILRFIGKQLDLYPKDDLLALRCDEMLDVLDDLQGKINAAGQGKEQAENESDRKEFTTNGQGAELLRRIDAFIEKNGANGFTVGNSLTIADLMAFPTLTFFTSGFYDGVPATALDGFAHIQAMRKTVATLPEVVKYLDDMENPHSAYTGLKECRNL